MTNATTRKPTTEDLEEGYSNREIDKDGSYRKLAVYLTKIPKSQMYEIITGRINQKDMENLMDEVGIEPYREVA
jgi:hypothetical protein